MNALTPNDQNHHNNCPKVKIIPECAQVFKLLTERVGRLLLCKGDHLRHGFLLWTAIMTRSIVAHIGIKKYTREK